MKAEAHSWPRGPWLSAGAVWALGAASACLNAWGWLESAAGVVALVLVALVIAAEILGLRLADRLADAFAAKEWPRFACGLGLFAGVVAFNAWSGHRALERVEAERLAPYRDAQAAHRRAAAAVSSAEADIEAVRAQIAREREALRKVPANIPASRIEALQAPALAELRRLAAERDAAEAAAEAAREALAATPAPAEPVKPISDAALWAIVALIEALKAFGLWAIGREGGVRAASAGPAEAPAPAPAIVQPAPDPFGGLEGRALVDALMAAGRLTRSALSSALASARHADRAAGLAR